MLTLPQVTLACVDTRLPRMAMDAMRLCMAKVAFGDAILFTAPGQGLADLPAGVRVVELGDVRDIESYSHFLLKGMGAHLRTSHLLIVQWDGYVLNPGMWDDAFLAVDYIGAVWPQFKDEHRVGNGGFSLRSRKLLDALACDEIRAAHPEDICIARTHRSLLETRFSIRFADEALAHRFAFERARHGQSSFGFHGMSNMATFLGEAELRAFLDHAPAALFGSVEARGFIKHLIARGMKPLARQALQQRRRARPLDLADLRLWARLLR